MIKTLKRKILINMPKVYPYINTYVLLVVFFLMHFDVCGLIIKYVSERIFQSDNTFFIEVSFRMTVFSLSRRKRVGMAWKM